jgi:hypothetical protein
MTRIIGVVLAAGLFLTSENAVARNFLYNSGFSVIQYGAGPWSIGAPAFFVDRWAAMRNSAGAEVSREPSLDGTGARFKLRVRRAEGNTSADTISLYQGLDTQRSLELRGRQITFSFYAKAAANYSPDSGALVSRVTFGQGVDEAASGAPTLSWTGASHVDVSHTLTGTLARFTHTVTVPLNSKQIGFSLLMTPTGVAGADDSFAVEALQVELGDTATPYQGQPVDEAFAECAMFYEDLARHPFTGYRHIRVIATAHANGNMGGSQNFAALVAHKTKRDFYHTLSVGPSDSWHVTAAAGGSFWGLVVVQWGHETVENSLLLFRYALDGAHPPLPDGYPVLLALDGGSKATKFAINHELSP